MKIMKSQLSCFKNTLKFKTNERKKIKLHLIIKLSIQFFAVYAYYYAWI